MSLLGAFGGFLGFNSNRNDAAGQGYTDQYGQTLSNNTSTFDNNATNAFNGYAAHQTANMAAGNQLANTNYMGGAQTAYQNQLANYGQQQNASQMLYNQATGQASSAADIQMQAGLGNANNQAQSAAYSQQGGISPGLTQRNMLGAQAQQNASIVSQGAAMRAQEQQAAQQQYANQLASMGQTAGNMTAQQQSLGAFAYQQGQANLNYNAQLSNQMYGNQQAVNNNMQQVGAANAGNTYNANMGNLDQAWKAQQQQSAALGNTATSAFTGAAGLF